MSSQADRSVVVAALCLAMERYGERITVSGSIEFKVVVIRAAVDAQLPITFADPALESRRHAEAIKAEAKLRPSVPPVGQEPPPHRRHGLHTLSQLDGLCIEGEAQRRAQVPATSAPTPARGQKSAPSELKMCETRLRAQIEAKRARRQGRKGRGA